MVCRPVCDRQRLLAFRSHQKSRDSWSDVSARCIETAATISRSRSVGTKSVRVVVRVFTGLPEKGVPVVLEQKPWTSALARHFAD